MSEPAVMDAPAAVSDAAPSSQQTPITPAPHQIPSLLGIQPSGAPQAPVTPTPSAPVVPDAAPSPSDASLPTPYYSTLIEKNPDLKAYEKTLARFDDTDAEGYVPKLAKSYAELAKFKGVLVPGVEASPEDQASYRKLNGIPAEAKDYKFSEGMEARFKEMGIESPEHKAIYAAAAHKANMTPGQFEVLSEAHGQIIKELVSAQSGSADQAQKANVQAMQKELGDRFDAVLGDAQKLHEVAFAGANLTESEQKDLESLTKSTAYTKLLASLSQRIPKESSVHRGAEGVFQSAQSQLATFKKAIMENPKHPFNDHTHPDHHKALDEFDRLQNDGKGWVS